MALIQTNFLGTQEGGKKREESVKEKISSTGNRVDLRLYAWCMTGALNYMLNTTELIIWGLCLKKGTEWLCNKYLLISSF